MEISTQSTEIWYDGDAVINYNGKDYAVRAYIQCDFEAEIEDFEYCHNARGSSYGYKVGNIRLIDCSSKNLALLDENDNEIEITDEAEIKKILNTKELFLDIEGCLSSDDVSLSDSEVDNYAERQSSGYDLQEERDYYERDY